MTGSRPTSRARGRSRTNTRSPASALKPFSKRIKDFERPGATGPMRGVAWFTHDDPIDRPPELFAGTNTLHTGGPHVSYLLLPMLPKE